MSKLKICLDAGHGMNTPGKRCLKSIDPKETREWLLNSNIVKRVQDKLKAYDVEVLRVDDSTGRTDVSLANRVKKANDWKADVYCSFHHNAGVNGGAGGGLVVITYNDSTKAVDLRNKLYDELLKAGGIKGNRSAPKVSNNGLYVLKYTSMIAVLTEFGFMDSTTDVPIILTDAFAEKMANGFISFLEKQYNIKKVQEDKPVPESVSPPVTKPSTYTVKVTASALNIRSGAGANFSIVGVIKNKGVYTITETRGNWGRLKSGAGWICLDYTKRV